MRLPWGHTLPLTGIGREVRGRESLISTMLHMRRPWLPIGGKAVWVDLPVQRLACGPAARRVRPKWPSPTNGVATPSL